MQKTRDILWQDAQQNLLDRDYRESTENLLAAGRSASVTLTWNIN